MIVKCDRKNFMYWNQLLTIKRNWFKIRWTSVHVSSSRTRGTISFWKQTLNSNKMFDNVWYPTSSDYQTTRSLRTESVYCSFTLVRNFSKNFPIERFMIWLKTTVIKIIISVPTNEVYSIPNLPNTYPKVQITSKWDM